MTEAVIGYRPVSVVGSDQQALRNLLMLHAVPDPRILDVTHNAGRMWQRTGYAPHRLDRNPSLKEQGLIDTVADFRSLPFEPASFDVIVFDPPHIADAGKNGITGGSESWGARFGTDGQDVHGQASVSHLFRPFLVEAKRVLVPGSGIVLAKIADQIHGGMYQWQHADLKDAALQEDMTPCDLMLTVHMNRGGLNDPRWKHVYHVRQVHCYWMVIRNAKGTCMSDHAPGVAKTERMPMFADLEMG